MYGFSLNNKTALLLRQRACMESCAAAAMVDTILTYQFNACMQADH